MLPPGRAEAPMCAEGMQPDPHQGSNSKPGPASAASQADTVGEAGTWGWGGRLSLCWAQQPRGANISQRKAMRGGLHATRGTSPRLGTPRASPSRWLGPFPPELAQQPDRGDANPRGSAPNSPGCPPTPRPRAGPILNQHLSAADGSCSWGFGAQLPAFPPNASLPPAACYKNYPGPRVMG